MCPDPKLCWFILVVLVCVCPQQGKVKCLFFTARAGEFVLRICKFVFAYYLYLSLCSSCKFTFLYQYDMTECVLSKLVTLYSFLISHY